MTRIGIVADTHGLLRPAAVERLQGVDLILHAGDLGAPTIVPALEAVAPVRAIRGNVDRDDWAQAWSPIEAFDYAGYGFYMLHDRKALTIDPAAAGFDVVVSGHSHKAHHETLNGVLYLNPGSIGPRRFKLPTTLMLLTADVQGLHVDLQTLP